MKKRGILGGTFNPIHNGHLHIAQQFYRQLGLDEILVVPARIPPHKEVPGLTDAALRMEMCRLACQDRPYLVPCAIELAAEGPSYTVFTLEKLKEQFPQDQLYLLMGSDMFLTLQQWYRYERILELAVVCGALREEGLYSSMEEQRRSLRGRGAQVELCPIRVLPISSTLVRERAERGESIEELVPKGVREYIEEHRLYGGKTDE